MPSFDVVVIGAGLAGLSAGCGLAEAGARVFVVGHGMAATHWAHGGIDVAGLPTADTSRSGIAALAGIHGHPYAVLADDVEPALATHRRRVELAGLAYRGDLDAPLLEIPTPIGGRRRAAILPTAQAAAAVPWDRDERLLVLGIAGFKDFWAPYMARNLRRLWRDGGPAEVEAQVVDLPDLTALHNLSATTVARAFDDASWRERALRTLAGLPGRRGAWRIAVPAVLGLHDHARAHAAVEESLGHPVFEVPGLPPSVPGQRLFEALQAQLLRHGGRIQVGFPVVRVERGERSVTAVHTEAASRTFRLAADRFILATGGLAGGGLRADPAGRIDETVLGLPVEAPSRRAWFSLDLGPHPLEAAGIRTDATLRPVDADGRPTLDNVAVVGSLLAGMRFLSERCGDGVALASAHRAAGGSTSVSRQPMEARA